VRLYGLEVGDRIILKDLQSTVIFSNQNNLKVGDLLYKFENRGSLSHWSNFPSEKLIPQATFIIRSVEYKSKLHKLLHKYIKESIAYIEIECWGLM